MRNIGKISRGWLAEIGILTINDLKRSGPLNTYRMIRERHGKRATLNLLWALEGAIRGIDCRDLSRTDKNALLLKLQNPGAEESFNE